MIGVIAENLMRAENTAVTPIDEIIKCQDEFLEHVTGRRSIRHA
jgi:hypothetical protein